MTNDQSSAGEPNDLTSGPTAATGRLLGPGPPSRSLPRRATGRLQREWKALGRLDDLAFWSIRFGLLLVLVGAGLFTAGARRLGGFWDAYAVLIGVTDPHLTAHPFTALAVSVLGWLAVPAVVGSFAAVVVERSITSHRSRSLKDL